VSNRDGFRSISRQLLHPPTHLTVPSSKQRLQRVIILSRRCLSPSQILGRGEVYFWQFPSEGW
jgi:hypothetical protein